MRRSAAYKTMIHDSHLADITTGGKIRHNREPTALIGPAFLPWPDSNRAINVDADMAEAFTTAANQPKPWRDIWSAGHGAGALITAPPWPILFKHYKDYHAAVLAQRVCGQRQLAQ